MKISVIAPVLNEVQFIGYSIMAASPYVDEFLYGLSGKSDDGTRDLLYHIKKKYLGDRLSIFEDLHLDDGSFPLWDFNPLNMKAYDDSFNYLINASHGDVVFFLHPDMIITEGPKGGIPPHSLAWYTEMTSYAEDFHTVITKGRTDKWKNIHKKTMGIHYFGGYGSQNEDFYYSDITGRSYKHYGSEFSKYPYQVSSSGIKINHYCELKDYKRRLEKMKTCLRTLYPEFTDERIEEMAVQHPRVTLEQSSKQFGHFEFTESKFPIPEVFTKYKSEFESFQKELVHG